ncbi:putative ribonuclease H-like domain-containing protein [Tanacetum coccineum]
MTDEKKEMLESLSKSRFGGNVNPKDAEKSTVGPWSDAPIIEEYESDSDDEGGRSGKRKWESMGEGMERGETVLTSTVLKVNTVKPIVNGVRPANVFHKTHSPSSKDFQNVSTRVPKGTPMTGTSYLAWTFQDFNGGLVAFGGRKSTPQCLLDVIEFCGLKGIKREYSNARTPQQNGVAKRKNRTFIEAARTMLADSFLPNTFWAEAVSTACLFHTGYMRLQRQGKMKLNEKLELLSRRNLEQEMRTWLYSGRSLGSSWERGAACLGRKRALLFKAKEKEERRNNHKFGEIQKSLDPSRFALWEKRLSDTRVGVSKYEGWKEEWLLEAIRIFLAFASYMGFIVYQMDVKSAFLYGKIDEEVYVSQPPGFLDPKYPEKVYKVVKALYGLHQAPRAWYATLSTFLLKNGYRRGTIDKTLFLKKDKHDIILVQVYVDDIIFGSTKKSWCDEFEALMKSRFQMSSMGELTFFLGLQVKQKPNGIFISQDKYVAEILKKFDFASVKTASTPIETQKPLVKDEEASDVDVHLYRSMIGSLMYVTASRPDIMFAVCACSRFQVTPKTSHLSAVKRIFRYLKGKPKLGLWYPRESSFDLESYSDSDYAGANLDRKSTTGGCQFLGRRLITWQCKKQTIVATSTTEAEYVAAASCCGQVLWIQNQMLDYGFNFMNTKIYIDNESTICIVKNPVYHSKTKHIAIRHHFIRDAYEKKLIQVLKIHTNDNVADLLTKAFDSVVRPSKRRVYVMCDNKGDVYHWSCVCQVKLISMVEHEGRSRPSPRPSPSHIIPDSIRTYWWRFLEIHSPEITSLSGNEDDMTLQNVYDLCISLCKQVSDQAKEIKLLKAKINKLKKQAQPVIKHHRSWIKSVSLKQRLPRKRFSRKQRMHKEHVSKQGRKYAKGESSVQGNPLFDELHEDSVEHMETNDAQDEGRTREMVDEEKEIEKDMLSTDDVLSADKEKVSTDRTKARIEADRILAEKLQEQEREQFTIEERAKFLHDTIVL